MGSDERILIACRYVPHDQWFLTNTSPSWKIKHLKQSIIAKALNLPFDRRLMMEDPTARPPSPITFAPIEGPLQESEFANGPGSYEVDKTQADYKMQGNDDGGRLTNDVGVTGTLSDMPIIEPSFAEYKSQICSSVFTLIRFSTGQILEEHFFVSWYNLEPHELVELHCSSPPTTFARALIFGQMLMNGGSLTVVPSPSQNSIPDRHASSSFPSPAVSATLSLTLTEPLRLTRLPRHDLASYTEPYWEGWIRILRVVWQSDLDRSPTGLAETFPQVNGLNDTRTKVKEWKERWAVISNGVLSLCKNRDDPTCTRLPLSALVSLCGAEYFSSGHSDNDIQLTNPAGGGGIYKRPTSSHSNLTPTIRASRTASTSDPSRVTTPVEGLGTWKYMLTATSNSATAPRVLSPLTTHSCIGVNKNPPLSATTAIDPSYSNHNHNILVSVDPERSRRERAAVREWERERMQKEQAEKARLDKQVEYTRWDDFVGFGGKSKAKSKEKEKERDNEKDGNRFGKFREEKEQKIRRSTATVLARHLLIGEGGPEKGNDCNREDRQREKLQDRLFHPDDRYIPASREEAIACGMLIVCAKFRIGVMEPMNKTRIKDENSALDLLRDIGSDSSVAGNGDGPGRKDSWTQGDKAERKAVRRQSQDLESSLAVKSLPPPRKASLPGPGNNLTMLTSGGCATPVGSMFGGFFGKKDGDNDKTDESDKQERSYLEVEEAKGKWPTPGSPPTVPATLRGMLDDYHSLSINSPDMDGRERLNSSVNNEILESLCPALPSPDYVNDRRFDEGPSDKGKCHRARYEPDDKHTEQASKEQKRRRRNEDRVEWVVMDLGTEIAYNSFLRILHRHSPPPTQSSFIPVSASSFHPQLPNPSHDVVPDTHGVLPYPEWRRDVVFRARSLGMREFGRPLELSFNLETQADQARKLRNEHGGQNLNRRRKNNVLDTDHGSDNDHNNTFGMEFLMLDDSDDGSEDESARWWQDIPRQLSSEGSHYLKWSTTRHGHSWTTEENAEEYSPLSPNMPFTDPFTFSPTHADFSESTLSSPVLGLDMEERLRPSISSSTLASNNTMSSFGASSSNLKGSIRSVISNEEMAADSPTGILWQNSSGSYQTYSHHHRIVSPSQTLSSPSSNESLGSYPYHRLPPRPFSPSSDIYLPNAYRQVTSGSASVLHHSASMPNASTWSSVPHAGRGMQTDTNREQAVTAPTLQKPILSAAQIRRMEVDLGVQLFPETPHDDPLAYDDFCANIDVLDRPILTPAQIHQIETETEAGISEGPTRDTPNLGITDSAAPIFNESSSSSTFRKEQLANNRIEKPGDDICLERDSRSEQPRDAAIYFEDSERGDGLLVRNNVTRRFVTAGTTRSYPTSPFSLWYQDYTSNAPSRSSSDPASISAKAILRRVRSGSSLQMPMGVHIEESEEDGRGAHS